jgi:hypothetical protein
LPTRHLNPPFALVKGKIKSLEPPCALVEGKTSVSPEPPPRPVIPAKAGIQNKNWLLSLLKQGLAFNKALHGFRQNSGMDFDSVIGPE